MTYTGKLTDEDLARLAEVRAEWMAIGLSTEPCDRDAATAAVLACYDFAGIERPPLVIWMDSPLGGLYASAVLRILAEGQLRGQLGGQLWDQLRGQLWGQLGGQLWGQLRGQLRGQLGDQLWDQLWGQLWGQLGGQLGGQLRDQLWGQLSTWNDAYWIAFYTEAVRIAPLERSESLDALAMAIGACGWWWPMRGAVIITDRPSSIARDKIGRAHV